MNEYRIVTVSDQGSGWTTETIKSVKYEIVSDNCLVFIGTGGQITRSYNKGAWLKVCQIS